MAVPVFATSQESLDRRKCIAPSLSLSSYRREVFNKLIVTVTKDMIRPLSPP